MLLTAISDCHTYLGMLEDFQMLFPDLKNTTNIVGCKLWAHGRKIARVNVEHNHVDQVVPFFNLSWSWLS